MLMTFKHCRAERLSQKKVLNFVYIYIFFLMKSAIEWRKSDDWRKTPEFLRKSEIFPVVIV